MIQGDSTKCGTKENYTELLYKVTGNNNSKQYPKVVFFFNSSAIRIALMMLLYLENNIGLYQQKNEAGTYT